MSPQETDFYTTGQIAALVGIHPRTLYAWLLTGRLPEPRRVIRGKVPARLFSRLDLERARELKAKNLPFCGR